MRLPFFALCRAKQVLASLVEASARPVTKTKSEETDNISFESLNEARVIERIKSADINTLTPYEAITLLYELKKELE